jgi:mono/diheme cytochrome c family protein
VKYFWLIFALSLVTLLSWGGFRGSKFSKPPLEAFPDMDRQWRFKAQAPTNLFPDGRTDRPVPAGTVPHINRFQANYTHLKPKDRFYDDPYLASGRIGSNWGRGFPIDLTNAALAEGQQLYTIFCAVCHSDIGDGNGITKQYGMVATANLLLDRYREMPEGQIFNTITNGYNTMGPYGAKITPEDRWKIVAYMRALQFAADAPRTAVPVEKQKELGL